MKFITQNFLLLTLGLTLSTQWSFCDGRQYEWNGPIVTVTLQDMETRRRRRDVASSTLLLPASASSPSSEPFRWSDLCPSLRWSIRNTVQNSPERQTTTKFPQFQSLEGNLEYSEKGTSSPKQRRPWNIPSTQPYKNPQQQQQQYLETLSSWIPNKISAIAKFRSRNVDIYMEPAFDCNTQESNLALTVAKGSCASLMTTFRNRALESIRGCFQMNIGRTGTQGDVSPTQKESSMSMIPNDEATATLRVIPAWNFQTKERTCLVEGTTKSKNTQIALDMQYENPSLSVIQKVNDRYVECMLLFFLLYASMTIGFGLKTLVLSVKFSFWYVFVFHGHALIV